MVRYPCLGGQAGCSYPLTIFLTHLLVSKHDTPEYGFSLSGRVTLFSTGSFLNGGEMSSMPQSKATFIIVPPTLALLHPQDERKSMMILLPLTLTGARTPELSNS